MLKEGGKSLLNEERIEQLEKEGFVWDVHGLTWEQNYNKLIAHKEKFGDCNVSKDNDHSLWLWTFTQKQMYNKKNSGKHSSITDERIKALNDIGFPWGVTHDEAWNTQFEALKKYKAFHGDW